ncbi:class I SAM-dependent methyltransferase [Corallibacter sp.]|uniref:class I SAM-dependent methyltransferase n=1 Tax=Corallibacter sp. TaxID=2038084 RepID=UPI003AB5ADB6
MAYAEYTRNNKSLIKRFSHQKRFDVAIKLIDLKANQSLLDFGTGDGYLLKCLNDAHKNVKLYGYDPLDFMFEELKTTIKENSLKNISITSNLSTLNSLEFDIVSCQEVLEHFSIKNQKKHLQELKKRTKDSGKIVISVPLEIGFSGLTKNIIRFCIGQNKEGATLKNIFKSFLGLKIPRQEEGYIGTHIGFNHKNLEALFDDAGLKVIKKEYSPFKFLYGLMNSQVFYVLKKQNIN